MELPTPLTSFDQPPGLVPQEVPVSIATPLEQAPPLIDISSEVPQATLNEKNAQKLADRYSIAFPKSQMDNQTVFEMLMAKKEADLRKQATSQKDFENTLQQQQILSNIAKTEGPMKLPRYLALQEIIKRNQADPNTIIEENFAEEFTKTLVKQATENPTGELANTLKELPEFMNQETAKVTDLVFRKQKMASWAERLQSAYDQQSYLGWGVDQAKSLTAIYGEAKLRGLVGGQTGYFDGLLGTNLRKQWTDLMFMPKDEFVTKGDAIVDKLIKDNPSMGLLWLSAGQGLSSDAEFLINVFPALDAGLVSGVAKGAYALTRRAVLEGIASRALASAIKEGGEATSTAAIKEAVGDVKGAAIEQFVNDTVQTGRATPVIKDMSSVMEAKIMPLEDLGFPQARGGFRQEIVNRLRESMNTTFGNFLDAVQKMMKVEQLPAVLAIPRVAMRLAAEMENQYRGLVNSIMDTRLVRDTTTGQWFASHYITRNDGSLFLTEQEAINYANKLKLGEVTTRQAEGPARKVLTKTVPELERDVGDIAFEGEDKYLKGSYRRTHLEKDRFETREFPEKITTPNEYGLEQKGAGFYIVKTKPVPIDADFVRDLMIQTAEQKTPNKVLNAFGGWLGSARTSEETLALENIINRKIATFGNATFYQVFKDLAQEISKLKSWPVGYKKKNPDGSVSYVGTSKFVKWNEWKDFISWLENVPNPGTGKKGVTEAFQTPGEFRDLYIQKVGRPPDEQELKATFAYQNQEFLKEQLLKFTKYKNQIREGATRWTIKGLNEIAGRGNIEGVVEAREFTGKQLDALPTSGTLLVMHKGEGGRHSVNAALLRDATRLRPTAGLGETLTEGVKSGRLRVVELIEPDVYPLNDFYNRNILVGRNADRQIAGDLRVTHVVSDNLEDKALSLDHIEINKPPNYDYDHYVVQPNIKYNPVTATHEYTGDKTIAGFNVRAMGAEVAEHLNEIRKLLKDNKEVAAREFYRRSGLPMDYRQIQDWFRSTISPEGFITPPRFNLDHDIQLVPHGKLSIETDKGLVQSFADRKLNFADRTKETYGQLGVSDPYDIFSLANSGTKEKPAWSVAPTKFIDPVTQINRSLVRVINDVHLNDYKVTSIEHWIQEARDLMKVKDSSLAAAPNYFFHNADNFWLPGLTGEKAMMQQNLMTSRMQIKQFLGVRDANTTFLHNAAQILADSIYTKYGEKPWILTLADKLPALRDPFQFMRSIAFNAKLGLFAVPQLLVQLQTFASIYGIAGAEHATSGTHATLLHTWSRINRNPEMINAFDKQASVFGFKPGWFKEAHELLDSTGFEHVAGEHSFRDSTTYHDLVTGPTGTFLNWGQWFFREGERASRTGAFYTAYKEFRDANPVRKLTEVDARSILQRADLLAGNMSRASSSTLQQGWMSLVTQFTNYTVRQAELILGSRLTTLERARLFGTYSALYGVPAAMGSFTFGVGNEWIMQKAIQEGYVSGAQDNSFVNTIVTEGLPAFLLHAATGNMYNFGQRYAGGSGPITDLLWSDKPVWEIFGGASGSTVGKSLANMNGMVRAVTSAISGTGEFKVKSDDFVAPLQEVSSVASWKRYYMALQTGKWLSQNELELGDASPLNALFMTLTGLSPQASPEIGWISHNRNQEKEIQQEGLKEFIKEWRRGNREFNNNNPEQGNDYWQRGITILRAKGYPQEDWPKAIAIANEGQESVASRMRLEYYLKNVPEQGKNILGINTGRNKDIANEALQRYMQGTK